MSETKQEKPILSVIVTVYNHAPYIERCLRGILAQKCDFPFEVWIGEDCSPDNTREVMKAIEPEFPENFHFIYREKNLNAGNNADLIERSRGSKYLAICEGDDFWTYEDKLQEQVAFLEAHPDYSACFHHCTVVGADSEPNGEKYPDCPEEEYSFKEYFYCTMPGQTGTLMVRLEDYLKQKERFLALRQFDSYPEDRRNGFILLVAGKVHVFQGSWSAYRHVVKEGAANYSSNFKADEKYAANEVGFFKTLLDYALRYGSDEAIECARACYYRVLLKWSVGKVKVAGLAESLLAVVAEKRWPSYLAGIPRWYAVLGSRMLRGRGVNL